MADPPSRCSGQLVLFGPGDVHCELGICCEVFEYLLDDSPPTRQRTPTRSARM
jgi:hypothetical protein